MQLLYIDSSPDPELVEEYANPHVFAVEVLLEPISFSTFSMQHKFPARRRYHSAVVDPEFRFFAGLLASFKAVFRVLLLTLEATPYSASMNPIPIIFAKHNGAMPEKGSPGQSGYRLVAAPGLVSNMLKKNEKHADIMDLFGDIVTQDLHFGDCQLLSSNICRSDNEIGYIPAATYMWLSSVLLVTAISQLTCFVRIAVELLLTE